MKRLTKLELEAIRIVVDERLAGDAAEFFQDAVGRPKAESEKLAEALKTAGEKLA